MTDALQLAALSLEEPGGTIFGDLAAEVETLAAAVRVARAHAHLTGPLDHRAAVLRVHADDETWADVLTTMYLTWSAAATTRPGPTRRCRAGTAGSASSRRRTPTAPCAVRPASTAATPVPPPWSRSCRWPTASTVRRRTTRSGSISTAPVPAPPRSRCGTCRPARPCTSVHVVAERDLAVHTRTARALLRSLVAAGPQPPPALVRHYDAAAAYAIGHAPHGSPDDLITARLLDHP
ncbi:hypothetical protein J2S42_007583 [Catenuloplanes indicus]|uniref:Uncharacterized protein n=1 Tax=Catenuloplanes indicus TaxID=137267 RepID=A0AAE3W7D5_9ACTN|nr:hypothetical protein [Catenuloplanes indicus]